MYSIEKKDYGFKLTFGGFIKAEEMEQWRQESKKALQTQRGSFGVMVDMRSLKPLPADAQAVMVEGQQSYKKKGMTRSAVILNSAMTTVQFRRLAKESGIYAWERYINAADSPNWEREGVNWIAKGVDPDQ